MPENNEYKRLTTVSFPSALLKEVDAIVKKKNSRYVSRADFCRAAVRKLLNEEKSKLNISFLNQQDHQEDPPLAYGE